MLKRVNALRLAVLLFLAISAAQAIATEPVAGKPTPGISFVEALRRMVDIDPEVLVQKTKLSAAGDQVMAARGLFTPSLSLSAKQQETGGHNGILAASGRMRIYSANAEWNIFRFGADVANLKSALAGRRYHQFLLDDAYLSAEEKSARSLFDLIEADQVLAARKRAEESVRHFVRIAEARFAKSLLSREESDKVAVDASNAEARSADAELQVNSARQAVEALLGETQVRADWPWNSKLTLDNVKRELSQDAAAELQLRPDLRAAGELVDSEDQRARSLFRAILPSLDLTYSVGETHMGQDHFSGWTGMATLSIPLWSGLKDYSAYRIQVESRSAAEIKLRQMQRVVKSASAAAQANYRVAVQQYEARQRNLKIARHILEQDEARFRMGRADANELNVDLIRVTEAEILAVRGLRQAHEAYLMLLHAYGKSVR